MVAMYLKEKPSHSYHSDAGCFLKDQPVVYLLHFDRPICDGHPARHYIGWTENLTARLEQHRAGRGARLLAVALERGIGWRLVRTWPGDRAYERRVKRWKMAPRLCPICLGTHPTLVLEQAEYDPAKGEIPW